MAENMVRSEKAAHGLTGIFGQLSKSVAAGELYSRILTNVIERSVVYQRITQAISKENLNRNILAERELLLRRDIRLLEQEERNAAGYMRELWGVRLAQERGMLSNLEKQKVLAKVVEEAGTARIRTAQFLISLTADLYARQRQFNQNLIEANSTFAHRNELMQRTLMLQTQSGISFANATSAARALVHYGMDTEATFEANLEIVSKMEQGLGVSVNESARLASVVERQVKGSFEGVARTIAQIVEDTALAGDEAARLSLNISTALGRLRPGLGAAGLPEVLRLVGRYEGALKEVGGASGALTQLLTQMTTPEGIVGAGALGVNPEFLATAQGVQTVMDRFGAYGQMLVGQSQGWERQMRLQALAQQFNVSADQANQLMLAIKRANEQQMGAISLQDRWKQQLNATNSGLSRLGNSLLGLIQTGLLPVVNLIGFLTNKLADFVEAALQFKPVVYVLGTGLTVAAIAATASLWGVARALWGVAVAGARSSGLAGLAGGAGGILQGTLGALVTGLRLVFLTPLGLIIGALVGLGLTLSWIYKIQKESRDEQAASRQIILSKSQAVEARRKAQIYSGLRGGGTAEDALVTYAKLANDVVQQFERIADPSQRRALTKDALDKLIPEMQLSAATAAVTRGMWTPLEELTAKDRTRENEIFNLSGKMYDENVKQRILMERDIQNKLEQKREQDEQNVLFYILQDTVLPAFNPWRPDN